MLLLLGTPAVHIHTSEHMHKPSSLTLAYLSVLGHGDHSSGFADPGVLTVHSLSHTQAHTLPSPIRGQRWFIFSSVQCGGVEGRNTAQILKTLKQKESR